MRITPPDTHKGAANAAAGACADPLSLGLPSWPDVPTSEEDPARAASVPTVQEAKRPCTARVADDLRTRSRWTRRTKFRGLAAVALLLLQIPMLSCYECAYHIAMLDLQLRKQPAIPA